MGIFKKNSKNSTGDIPAICDVDLERFLGTWYEISRLPHKYEDGLENVTATYRLKDDGDIEVINAGFKDGKESVSKAKAWISDDDCTGKLIVSFFWPIKSEYNIIKLDKEHYNFAVITSNTKDTLWILSREPKMSDELYEELISFVSSNGFDTSKIIKVNHSTS